MSILDSPVSAESFLTADYCISKQTKQSSKTASRPASNMVHQAPYHFQGRVNLKDLNHDLQEYQKSHGLDDDQMHGKVENLMNAFADLEIRPSSMAVFGPKSVIDSDTFTEMTEDDRQKLPRRTLNLTSTSMGGKSHKKKVDTIKDIQKSVTSGFNAGSDESGDEVVSPRSTPEVMINGVSPRSTPERSMGGFMGRFRRSVTPAPAPSQDAGKRGRGRSVPPAVSDHGVSEDIQQKYGKSNKWAEVSELCLAKSLEDVKLMFTVEKLKLILQNNSVDYGKITLKEPLAKMVWSGLSDGSLK